MTKKDLLKIRKNLPHGSVSKLAEDFGFTKSYIHLILKGKRQNNSVLIAAVELANNAKQELESLSKKTATL